MEPFIRFHSLNGMLSDGMYRRSDVSCHRVCRRFCQLKYTHLDAIQQTGLGEVILAIVFVLMVSRVLDAMLSTTMSFVHAPVDRENTVEDQLKLQVMRWLLN